MFYCNQCEKEEAKVYFYKETENKLILLGPNCLVEAFNSNSIGDMKKIDIGQFLNQKIEENDKKLSVQKAECSKIIDDILEDESADKYKRNNNKIAVSDLLQQALEKMHDFEENLSAFSRYAEQQEKPKKLLKDFKDCTEKIENKISNSKSKLLHIINNKSNEANINNNQVLEDIFIEDIINDNEKLLELVKTNSGGNSKAFDNYEELQEVVNDFDRVYQRFKNIISKSAKYDDNIIKYSYDRKANKKPKSSHNQNSNIPAVVDKEKEKEKEIAKESPVHNHHDHDIHMDIEQPSIISQKVVDSIKSQPEARKSPINNHKENFSLFGNGNYKFSNDPLIKAVPLKRIFHLNSDNKLFILTTGSTPNIEEKEIGRELASNGMDFKDIRYINIGDAILICGGNISRGEAIKKAFILNYEEGEIITQEYPSMLYGRKRHNLVLANMNINYKKNEASKYKNFVFCLSGVKSKYCEFTVIDHEGFAWYELPQLANVRSNASTLICNNRLYIYGGFAEKEKNSSGYVNSIESLCLETLIRLYNESRDFTSLSWRHLEFTKSNIIDKSAFASICLNYDSNIVYIVGGFGVGNEFKDEVYKVNVFPDKEWEFEQVGQLPKQSLFLSHDFKQGENDLYFACDFYSKFMSFNPKNREFNILN